MPIHSTIRHVPCLIHSNTLEIITAAALSYLLITGKDFEFEKVTVSEKKILMTVGNTFTTDDKNSPLSGDNFMQPIQILLSQKRKEFLFFFSAVLK